MDTVWIVHLVEVKKIQVGNGTVSAEAMRQRRPRMAETSRKCWRTPAVASRQRCRGRTQLEMTNDNSDLINTVMEHVRKSNVLTAKRPGSSLPGTPTWGGAHCTRIHKSRTLVAQLGGRHYVVDHQMAPEPWQRSRTV